MDNRARDFWTPLVNFYLTQLDATLSGTSSRVIVIGASNHAHLLDPALVRPGRLHPVIRIERPDAAALAGIMRGHLKEDLAGEDLSGLAQLAVGATGADVVGFVKAARAIARAAARRMVVGDLAAVIAPPDERSEEEVRIIALHEAAHAAAVVHYDCATLQSVSIAMAGSSAGSTRGLMHPRHILTREQSETIAIVSLSGRAMDALGGAPNSGSGGAPGSDLARATATIALMHGSQGLGDSLVYRGGPDDIARALAADPDLRGIVERDLQRLYAKACAFVREHRTAIEAIAERLIADRVLPGKVVEDLMRGHRRAVASASRGGRDAR